MPRLPEVSGWRGSAAPTGLTGAFSSPCATIFPERPAIGEAKLLPFGRTRR